MVEKATNKKHQGRKPDDNSFSHIAFIILESGRPHDIDEALTIFKEVHPGKDDKQYKQAMLNVIYRVKKGEKRYADYMWSEDAFQMVKKNG